jgi:hypothetical protein
MRRGVDGGIPQGNRPDQVAQLEPRQRRGEGAPVATRDVFSADELAQLRGFPEIGRAELIRFFITKSDADATPAAPVER